MDAIARRNRCDEDVGAAELDVDPPGAADNDAAENIFEPSRGSLGIRTAQMDMIPGDDRHRFSPLILRAVRPARCVGRGMDAAPSILAAACRQCHPLEP
jgi:hypothetical protein